MYSITCVGPKNGRLQYTTQFFSKSFLYNPSSNTICFRKPSTKRARNTFDIAFTGKVRNQHPAAVAHKVRGNVLVSPGFLDHGTDVNTAFVCKGAFSDKRPVVGRNQVGRFTDEA